MVVNGASRRSVGFWAKHLANDKKNDRAELKEIRGLGATNLRDGLLEMQDDARHTRCQNFFYQANFNPCAHERLTEEQWQRAFEIFEKHRGIPEGQARIVYEHEKEGRIHRHVIWSRIDLEKMRAWPDPLDAKVCHAASREISEELGLERTISPFDKDREGPRPERAPKSYEMFRGLRSGLDPREIKSEVTRIFRDSRNGADFAAGLKQQGYELVQGDRRDYCILDSAGEVHSLARRLDGINAKQLREFMQGFQHDALPTIEQAKTRQQERLLDERQADLASVQREIAWEEALARAAIEKEKKERRFVEPTQEQIREQGAREKLWPVNAPVNEKTATSPQYHIHDAAREATKTEQVPVMPEKLYGAAKTIWTAYNIRMWERKDGQEIPVRERDPNAFKRKLEEEGIALASVTKDEADRSHREAEFARAVRSYAPSYREGEIVAVTTQGHVHKLGQRTTGAEPRQVEQFLKTLDRTQLLGIEATKETLRERSAQRIVEVQGFRDLLKGAKLADRFERAGKPGRQGRAMSGRDNSLPKVGRMVASAGIAAAGGVIEGVARTAEGILGILDPVLTPTQKLEGMECPALFVPVCMRETGMRGALNGTWKEAYG
jgi:hypothetical protein